MKDWDHDSMYPLHVVTRIGFREFQNFTCLEKSLLQSLQQFVSKLVMVNNEFVA